MKGSANPRDGRGADFGAEVLRDCAKIRKAGRERRLGSLGRFWRWMFEREVKAASSASRRVARDRPA